jgi:hypothetical protein
MSTTWLSKTTNEDNLIAELTQTFANLRVYRWKLRTRSVPVVDG